MRSATPHAAHAREIPDGCDCALLLVQRKTIMPHCSRLRALATQEHAGYRATRVGSGDAAATLNKILQAQRQSRRVLQVSSIGRIAR